jgi:signal transduction histidine kinase
MDVNDIAKGLDEAVTARVQAEKMKSELITNVSHDLKTPITSIINYTELLSKIKSFPKKRWIMYP